MHTVHDYCLFITTHLFYTLSLGHEFRCTQHIDTRQPQGYRNTATAKLVVWGLLHAITDIFKIKDVNTV